MTLTDRFTNALLYATELHGQQRRKASDVPYLAHLLAVASLVMEHGTTEDEVIAALLHDAVEDQGGAATRDEIRRRFGDEVVAIVDGCTDTDLTPKPPWRQRKEAYIERLAHGQSSVRLVSAADKLHNVRSLIDQYHQQGEHLWSHFRGGRDGTLWYYCAVADALRQAGDHKPLVEQLDRTVNELEQLARSNIEKTA